MTKDLICNNCGRKLLIENGIPKEDYVEIKKEWGYFSNKDGCTEHLVICEKCYDSITSDFKIPVDSYKTIELL